MKIAKTIESVRRLVSAARSRDKRIGFVPTMGALHIGHIALINSAAKKCDFVVVSIFVNPTQFGAGEDFQKYPRPLEADLEICKKAGVDVVFAPSTKQMYPAPGRGGMYPRQNLTWVNVEKLTGQLCGRFRPGHFRGVATVCAKLFNIVQPDIAFFGQKDAQQTVIIRQMVADLNMPLKIVVCPTVREAGGLAVSSRNRYLTDKQKEQAAYIYKSLRKARQMIDGGTKNCGVITRRMRKILNRAAAIKVEYINIVDAETLQPAARIAGKILIAAAVKIGTTRLIDNILIDAGR
jgi:pantoate--beta-alanine ligase